MLLSACGGVSPTGSAPDATSTADAPTARTPAAEDDAAPATASAEDAALAACAAIDAMPLGGTEPAPLREQERALTLAAEQLRLAAEDDVRYLEGALVVEEMASGAADALALLEEHGEDVTTWEAEAQESWATYAMQQADAVMVVLELCNAVDPPGDE
ncbi:hypothetical protein GXB85_05880 [Cellulomonas sp. APG4]|uniref:hypothetical protein n=1 Tax=Cellulomonas sp. APG4 TaxID=1538656 RepID=UPI00137B4E2E|nr:hypothetical protein [Cellulomonas sp. APG4]NCT90477.1 hypothetical protein [Cellulomonas sp. APG4]